YHFAASACLGFSAAFDGSTLTQLELNSQPQNRSTTSRNTAMRIVVANTTMVSWVSRLRLVQETLFISASVAIRNSAKVGTFTAAGGEEFIDAEQERDGDDRGEELPRDTLDHLTNRAEQEEERGGDNEHEEDAAAEPFGGVAAGEGAAEPHQTAGGGKLGHDP